VQTSLGTDVVVSMPRPQPVAFATALGPLTTDGRLAVALGEANRPTAACLVGGTKLSLADTTVSCPVAASGGKVLENASGRGESHFVLEGELDAGPGVVGQALLVQDGAIQRAYPIRAVETAGNETHVYTKRDGVGFEARPGITWQFLPVAAWERRP
jgi:hypothetical protein